MLGIAWKVARVNQGEQVMNNGIVSVEDVRLTSTGDGGKGRL